MPPAPPPPPGAMIPAKIEIPEKPESPSGHVADQSAPDQMMDQIVQAHEDEVKALIAGHKQELERINAEQIALVENNRSLKMELSASSENACLLQSELNTLKRKLKESEDPPHVVDLMEKAEQMQETLLQKDDEIAELNSRFVSLTRKVESWKNRRADELKLQKLKFRLFILLVIFW